MGENISLYVLADILAQSENGARAVDIAALGGFRRRRLDLADGGHALIDTFPDYPGASCIFIRLARGGARVARLSVPGVKEVVKCAAGGWLLRGVQDAADSVDWWIPQTPVARTVDANGRILSQRAATLCALGRTADQLWAAVDVPADAHVDLTLWHLPALLDAVSALTTPLSIERQRWFLRGSHTAIEQLADLYLCLVHGYVYDNRFVWRRIWGGFRWRICSEIEAHSLYMALNGLECATGRILYELLKRQVLGSIIARQAPDGGWYHGEWTDFMESHFRLHNAGVLILEAALEASRDPLIAESLQKAASFCARQTDRTDVGVWFLHDSLEESVETASVADAPPWVPTRVLGASASNKLILNTHLDAIVALDRYRELTGDSRHAESVASARDTARRVLAMRPAGWLYGLVYRAVWLTLMPSESASRLSLLSKVIRRLTRRYAAPLLHRLKLRFPRFVMPGGLIDRHLSPKHFDMGYHTVNLMDVVRVARRFPSDDFRPIIDGAIAAVTSTGLLKYWLESKQRQPIGYWVEALYHLCMLDPSRMYRLRLAEAMLFAEQAGIGLPPALMGADPEAVSVADQVPCPSLRDRRLRVANLSCGGRREFLVVNPVAESVALAWDSTAPADIEWTSADGEPLLAGDQAPLVPAHGSLYGKAS